MELFRAGKTTQPAPDSSANFTSLIVTVYLVRKTLATLPQNHPQFFEVQQALVTHSIYRDDRHESYRHDTHTISRKPSSRGAPSFGWPAAYRFRADRLMTVFRFPEG
jgi:hypothetical protein